MKRSSWILAGMVCFILGFFLSGCIRLWGGATYVKSKPGDYEEKTVALDTGQISADSNAKGNIH